MLTVCIIVMVREECPVVSEVRLTLLFYDLGNLSVLSYLSAFLIVSPLFG